MVQIHFALFANWSKCSGLSVLDNVFGQTRTWCRNKTKLCRRIVAAQVFIQCYNRYVTSACSLVHGGSIDVYLPRSNQEVQATVLYNSAGAAFYAVHEDMILGVLACNCKTDGMKTDERCSVEFTPQGGFAPPAEHRHDSDRNLEVFQDGYRWADAVVYYEISEELKSPLVEGIHAAAWAWTQNSPVRMIESSEAQDRLYISGTDLGMCSATLGKTAGGPQLVTIALDGGCGIGNIMHELGHAIGWNHEHLRADRDDYITVQEEFIIDGYEDMFEKKHGELQGVHPYDYGSLMHYPVNGFTTDRGKQTIKAKSSKLQAYKKQYPNDLPDGVIGQRIMMSTIDKQMGYTYLSGCHEDNNLVGSAENNEPQWHTSPWGGCAAQASCDGGPAFRERFVTCRQSGKCVGESLCDAAEKPPTRQPCEFAPHNLNVTFDEPFLGDVGVPLSNTLFYDQLDWQVWSGPLPKLLSGNTFSMDFHSAGPQGDASEMGEGRYLWFSGRSPTKQNDQAWYETPVVSTTSTVPCTIDFDWFVHGNSGELRVELVSCSDCQNRQIVWASRGTRGQWAHASVSLPVVHDSKARVRFTAVRGGQGKYSNVGLDNIAFSPSCTRQDFEEIVGVLDTGDPGSEMVFPHKLTSYCIYRSERPFASGAREISLVACGLLLVLGMALGSVSLHCYCLRLKLRQTIAGGKSNAEVHKAQSVLKAMNARTMSHIIAGEAMRRLESAISLPVEATAMARDSFTSQASFSRRRSTTLVMCHRNKSAHTMHQQRQQSRINTTGRGARAALGALARVPGGRW
eukprot:CAMPEP_0206376080 /NCGR_PEP_ID=MMETSP0294-20121207/9260_1 /ASSEMBLY_ACC=CAM_ASM_000327 /TAXON_ID=39354 /ORGANISM="Heterosigma akashiwo, Strain CCMP2393" /LENGTH=795 /DNA_ID=CAMNT_0053824119 /DNA_START=101 /DNA_END=2485 /DNA_ORIENTATION=-